MNSERLDQRERRRGPLLLQRQGPGQKLFADFVLAAQRPSGSTHARRAVRRRRAAARFASVDHRWSRAEEKLGRVALTGRKSKRRISRPTGEQSVFHLTGGQGGRHRRPREGGRSAGLLVTRLYYKPQCSNRSRFAVTGLTPRRGVSSSRNAKITGPVSELPLTTSPRFAC